LPVDMGACPATRGANASTIARPAPRISCPKIEIVHRLQLSKEWRESQAQPSEGPAKFALIEVAFHVRTSVQKRVRRLNVRGKGMPERGPQSAARTEYRKEHLSNQDVSARGAACGACAHDSLYPKRSKQADSNRLPRFHNCHQSKGRSAVKTPISRRPPSLRD
jgi:hypothetical protein